MRSFDPPPCPECCGNPRLLCRGTKSSNPSLSSEESANFRSLSGGRIGVRIAARMRPPSHSRGRIPPLVRRLGSEDPQDSRPNISEKPAGPPTTRAKDAAVQVGSALLFLRPTPFIRLRPARPLEISKLAFPGVARANQPVDRRPQIDRALRMPFARVFERGGDVNFRPDCFA